MTDEQQDVLSDPGRRSPLIILVAVVVVVAIAGWLISRNLAPVEDAGRSEAPGTPLISPLGPAYASTGPTFAPAAEVCSGPDDDDRSKPVIVAMSRVASGPLSYEEQAGYRSPAGSGYPNFASDVVLQSREVFSNSQLSTPGRTAVLAVGRLARADGFTGDTAATTRRVLRCVLAVDASLRGAVTRLTRDEDHRVLPNGTGHLIEADAVVVNDSGFPGEHLTVVVVPDGSDWAMFLASAPIGSGQAAGATAQALASLRVEA